ncbi:MAG: hypothetical protein E3J43_07250 [Candidatus Heimdallarchaeota archaeon]|nr:MAG: hypothetical protein E3J43_07250 [Candidatus Heimdallarchaeota archaeon]
MDIIITITDEEKRILESWLGTGQIQPWLQDAIDNKIRQRVDASILEETDRNPKKMTKANKLLVLKDIVLPTRIERDRKD